jgi:hypothetical protein
VSALAIELTSPLVEISGTYFILRKITVSHPATNLGTHRNSDALMGEGVATQ